MLVEQGNQLWTLSPTKYHQMTLGTIPDFIFDLIMDRMMNLILYMILPISVISVKTKLDQFDRTFIVSIIINPLSLVNVSLIQHPCFGTLN